MVTLRRGIVTKSTEDKQCIKLVSLHAYIDMHGQHNLKHLDLFLTEVGRMLRSSGFGSPETRLPWSINFQTPCTVYTNALSISLPSLLHRYSITVADSPSGNAEEGDFHLFIPANVATLNISAPTGIIHKLTIKRTKLCLRRTVYFSNKPATCFCYNIYIGAIFDYPEIFPCLFLSCKANARV
jgi:hypothetical protein